MFKHAFVNINSTAQLKQRSVSGHGGADGILGLRDVHEPYNCAQNWQLISY